LERSQADNCVYHRRRNDNVLIIAVYVDDLLILANNMDMIDQVKQELSFKFEMTDLGEVHYCLGIQIIRDRSKGVIEINQSKYVEDVLKRFNMENSKPAATPMQAGVRLTKGMSPSTEEEIQEMEDIPYQSAIGSLMYAMLGTRPDLSYAVGALSQYSSKPGKEHWRAVKWTLRYLKGSIGYRLQYRRNGGPLQGYSDADWAGNLDDRRSTTGYVFLLGGASISWGSKKQPTVALSTTEAEYMALCQTAKEGIWLERLLGEIGYSPSLPVAILSDNQGAIDLTKNSVYHARTKHIDIRHHFLRDVVEAGQVGVSFCGTEEMVADVLTKGLAKLKHSFFCKGLGLV
jgi:hypothetical protein